MNALDLFYLPAAILTAPWWARKARGGWRERFGHTPPLPPKVPGTKRLVLHAVSVGEVNTLRTLVPMLRDDGIQVVVSTTTDTGLARAKSIFAESPLAHDLPGRPGVKVVRYPLDLSSAVARFLDAIQPDAVALVELEIWPNFVSECGRRGVPVAVINGRLSARSFRGYHRFHRFLSPSFRRLEFAAVQDESYAARFRTMGVSEPRIRITGSMKWDAITLDASPTRSPINADAERLAAELGIDRSRPLIVAGSTAPTGASCEEALLHAACPPGTQLLCAPRKPEHYERAFAALGGRGRCTRRSIGSASKALPAQSPIDSTEAPPRIDRFLLDTIGELRSAYALADVAVVGRSFGNLRGSDPIEPIALGKPTVIGPAFANFEYIVGRFAAARAIRICTPGELAGVLADLLASPQTRQQMAEAGRACILAERGASGRHAAMLKGLLSPASSARPNMDHRTTDTGVTTVAGRVAPQQAAS